MAIKSVSRTRGRPVHSEQYVSDMRSRIGKHAFRLFQTEGYEAISIRRLAKEAGCTVMTLYRYYPRKIDILRDLWAQIFGRIFDLLDQIAASHLDPKERIEAVAQGYVNFWLENRDQYFMVFMSSKVDQSDVSIFVQDDVLLGRFLLFRHCIEDAAAASLSEAEITIRSEFLLCALHGIAHNLITISAYPWSNPKQLIRAAINTVIHVNI
jgi:AcrR family transcriptional regulator